MRQGRPQAPCSASHAREARRSVFFLAAVSASKGLCMPPCERVFTSTNSRLSRSCATMLSSRWPLFQLRARMRQPMRQSMAQAASSPSVPVRAASLPAFCREKGALSKASPAPVPFSAARCGNPACAADRGRIFSGLPGVPWCRSPCAGQSRIRASVRRAWS